MLRRYTICSSDQFWMFWMFIREKLGSVDQPPFTFSNSDSFAAKFCFECPANTRYLVLTGQEDQDAAWW